MSKYIFKRSLNKKGLLLGHPSIGELVDPSGQIWHLSPENPGLHSHFPVKASHFPLSEPMTAQPQSEKRTTVRSFLSKPKKLKILT